MSLQFRLSYINKDNKEEGIIELMKLSSDYSQGENSFNTKIIEGSMLRGIKTGSGLIKHGRKADFSIPIFEKKEKSIEEQIVFFTRLFSNANDTSFYLQRFYKDKWYSAEVAVLSFGSYTAKTSQSIGSVKISLAFIDNLYISEIPVTKRIFENTIAGTHKVCFSCEEQDTDAPVPCSFVWKLHNSERDLLEASFSAARGYGIMIREIADKDTIITFDGKNVEVNGEIRLLNGMPVEALPGKTHFEISSTFDTVYFDLTYKPAVIL